MQDAGAGRTRVQMQNIRVQVQIEGATYAFVGVLRVPGWCGGEHTHTCDCVCVPTCVSVLAYAYACVCHAHTPTSVPLTAWPSAWMLSGGAFASQKAPFAPQKTTRRHAMHNYNDASHTHTHTHTYTATHRMAEGLAAVRGRPHLACDGPVHLCKVGGGAI